MTWDKSLAPTDLCHKIATQQSSSCHDQLKEEVQLRVALPEKGAIPEVLNTSASTFQYHTSSSPPTQCKH